MNDNEPAFPQPICDCQGETSTRGMTLRQYACIQLRVPDSGEGWLDDLIRRAKRDEFAGLALAALTETNEGPCFGTVAKPENPWQWYAKEAYQATDAMLAEREKCSEANHAT